MPPHTRIAGWFSSIPEKLRTWRHLPRLLAALWRVNPVLAGTILALRLARAFQPPLALYVGKLIVDEIILQTRMPADGAELADWWASGRLSALATWIGLELLLTAGGTVLGRLSVLAEGILAELNGNALGARLIEHAARLDLRDIEASEFQDRLQRARVQTMIGDGLLAQLLGQAQDAITVAALVAGLIAYVPALVLLLLLALIPALFGEAHFNAQGYGLNAMVTPERRQMEYVRHVGSSAETAKEVKLFGLGPFLSARFTELATAIHRANRRLAIRKAAWGSLFGAVSSLSYYVAYAVIAWRTMQGQLSIGELTFLAGSLLRLNGLFERLMLGFTQITAKTYYLDDLFSFLDTRPAMSAPAQPRPMPKPMRQGITFDRVGFRYPGKDTWAVRNLSFTLAAGETLALVGENGAGKTTIVKLMTRLCDPDDGRVLIDGVDIREIDLAELRDQIGTIFQDFTRYNWTVAENIGIGRVAASNDRPRIVEAARSSLADPLIDRLPAGYDQMLGRAFARGTDLSGGEWQKLAIARAYFRDADLLILDEPTAALDARAEAEVFERFKSLSRSRTALLISHRFSTVRMADRILVLEGGQILESGSHDELMARDGRYAELFRLQAAGFL